MENNLILLVMLFSVVPVILLRNVLGTGILRILKGGVIWFALSIFGTMIVTSSKERVDTSKQNENIITSKIYLKNITTGVKSNEISGLKYVLKQSTMDTASTDLLGENRVVTLHKADGGLIYKVETVGQDFSSEIIDMKNAIEERLTRDNGKSVRLQCIAKNEGVLEDKTQICSVSNESQKLTLKYVKFKPDGFVNNFMWSIVLEDLSLTQSKNEKENKYWQNKRAEDLKKMKEQI